MILFLDFDGVLHPDYENYVLPDRQLFCHLCRLEDILRDFPKVEVVISSMWRYQLSLDQIRLLFSTDIANRIIGKLPQTEYFDLSHVRARREKEILIWLSNEKRTDEAWIALDDCPWNFQLHLDHLIVCNAYTGLNDQSESKLRAALLLMK